MSAAAMRGVVRRLGPPPEEPTDSDLVAAFAARRDPDAFAALVHRHGPTVLGVCRRVLGDAHDAEDAFQAVFLVLARRVGAVRPPGAVGGWLYGVAVRTASKARVAAARRRRREMIAATKQANPDREAGGGVELGELRAALDEELARLPDALRAAVVLCDLHGKTRAEAAAELRCPEGTVAARLHRARKKLGDALARRGLALPTAGLVSVLAPASLPASVARSAVASALGSASAEVAALARAVTRSLTTTTHAVALGAVTLLAGGLLAAVTLRPSDAPARPPAVPPPPAQSKADRPATQPGPATPWKEAKVLEPDGWLAGSVLYSADGKTLFVGGTSGAGHVQAFDVGTGKPLWETKLDGRFAALALAPDGKTLAVTTKDGVQFLDAVTGKKTGDGLEETGSEPLAVAYFPDTVAAPGVAAHKVIFGTASRYFTKTWTKWPLVSTTQFVTRPAGKEPPDAQAVPLAVDPGGKRVVVAGPLDRTTGKQSLLAWSAGSGEPNKLLEGHKAAVTCAAWSKDGRTILTGDAEGVVIVWDATTFQERARRRFGPRITAVAISPDGAHLAAAIASLMPAPNGRGDYTEEVFVWRNPDEPRGKIVRRQPEGVVEIDLGSKQGVKPGDTFSILPADFPEKGIQSRIRKVRVKNERGEYRDVDKFVPKGTIEVREVIGPNLSRAKITLEADAIRDGIAAGDRVYDAVDQTGQGLKPLFRNDAGGPFEGIASLTFAPDGRSLAVAFANFTHLTRLGELRGRVRIFSLGAPEPPEAEKKLREQLKKGTPAEKSDALRVIRQDKLTALIPDLIEAIEDPTPLPRDGDTGWGFVGHQAASVLGEIARSLDGVPVGLGPANRPYERYSFHTDSGEGGAKLKESGRLAEVRKNWADWWEAQRRK
jgi:RNA polymerase sigma factor (sigma-70 family)